MSETKEETPTPATAAPTPMNHVVVASHLTLLALWLVSQYIYIPYPIHLLTLVTAILYVASHQSLFLCPEVHDKLLQLQQQQEQEEDADGSTHSGTMSVEPRETMRKEDAYQFPLVGSCALFGLYLAFKYLDKDLVNLLIGLYFSVAGVVAVTMTFATYVEGVVPAKLNQARLGWQWMQSHPLPEWLAGPSPWDLSMDVTPAQLLSLVGALGVLGLYHSMKKAWYLNNILGISFCLQGIRNFSVGSYQIAAILLIGLFFYDIFWVFGTEVMVKVATNLDGPIKLLLPRESLEKDPETGRLNLSLLGLGDIVIPGFFLSLMLRFDFYRWSQKMQQQQPSGDYYNPMHVEHVSFSKPYFHSTLVGYVVGLGTTLWVMFQFNAAQPALLYLVPACLGSSFGCALVHGEVKALLDYTEEEEEEEAPAEDEAKDEKPAEQKKDD